MMKLKKFLLVFILIVPLLSGCHGSKGNLVFEIPEKFDTEKTYEITFWAKNDTNKTQTDIYQKAITDFEKLYPNIKVNIRLYTDYGKIYNDVITNIATNTTPNVCITYPDHIATYLSGNNTVVPLDDLFNNSQYGFGGSELSFDGPFFNDLVPEFINECVLGEHYYAIPYMRSTEACYINKTYVEKLGYEVPDVLTWDFVWEVSEAAMAKNDDGTFKINSQNVLIPFIYKSTDNMMIQMLNQLNAPYSDENGSISIFSDETKEVLFEIAKHAKTQAFSTFKISSYPANFLNAGQCIFAIDSTAGSTWMGSHAPLSDISADKYVEFETAVRMIPQYDPQNPKMISQGPSICIFNKNDSQEVLASWLFAQYLLTNEVQIAYSSTEGYVPVTLKAQNSDEYQAYLKSEGKDYKEHYAVKLQATKLFLDNTNHCFVTPVFNGSASLRDASGQMIEEVTKAVRRKKTINNEFINKLYNDMRSLYHLNNSRQVVDGGIKDLGELPTGSKLLLGTLATSWIGIGGYYLYTYFKKKKS